MTDQSGILFFTDNDTIKSRKIDLQGKLTGKERAAFNSPIKKTLLRSPDVAFSTNANGTQGLLLANEGEEGTISWAQLLDSKGNPVGTPVQVYGTSVDERTAFGLLIALPGKPSDSLFRFIWYVPLQQLSTDGTVSSSGIVQLKLTVDVR